MNIIGVDFSGAEADASTWICRGVLDGNTLSLQSSEPLGRRSLTNELKSIKQPIVAALDFPFSVPLAFAKCWNPEANTMLDLWHASVVSGMSLKGFDQQRNDFVEQHRDSFRNGEPKRRGDEHHFGCFSPLHTVQPKMTNMTFRGMQMLHELSQFGFRIPPLSASHGPIPHTRSTLLEVMPGAVLKHLGLPSRGYKNGRAALVQREFIWSSLPSACGLGIEFTKDIEEKALKHHDCLDSVVASIAAALWDRDPANFRCQPEDADEVAKLEGWLCSLNCDKPQLHSSSN